ncbi:VQ motif-containing protein 1-like [Senna tora]|uniref:VQ motif-containing protein 1-like n=1 Tax=Senna tora TaxID=362788 RepID=A0A835CFQ4_9FABA|nr:VQ motif-containing protein 1-like [Senna tora]
MRYGGAERFYGVKQMKRDADDIPRQRQRRAPLAVLQLRRRSPNSRKSSHKTYWIIKVRVVLCDSEHEYGSIHHFGFDFVAADRIKSGELDQNILVDVILIGRVFNMFQVHLSSPNDPKTKRVTVDIEDSAKSSNSSELEGVKIVHIETRYVEIDAVNFRAVVQSLTGKDASTSTSIIGDDYNKGGNDVVVVKNNNNNNNVVKSGEKVGWKDMKKKKNGDVLSSMKLNNLSFKDLERLLAEFTPMDDFPYSFN